MFFREKRIHLPVSVPVAHPLARREHRGKLQRRRILFGAHGAPYRRWSRVVGFAAFLHADSATAWVARLRFGPCLRTTAGRCFLGPKISRMDRACGRVRRAHHVFPRHRMRNRPPSLACACREPRRKVQRRRVLLGAHGAPTAGGAVLWGLLPFSTPISPAWVARLRFG